MNSHQILAGSVLCEEKLTSCGKRIGVLTLNKPASLNAITTEMTDLISKQLSRWRDDENLVCVLFKATGDKAFCAGGDIQALYRAVIENPGQESTEAEAFFAKEYRLDYIIHTYPKPVVCWANGIVLGGGMGLLAACSHIVVTDKTRAGMPEITIGLFPDVGGSWFLNRMPGSCGVFLGLTGALMNAADCVYTGLSEYVLASDAYQVLEQSLLNADWQASISQHDVVSDTLRHLHQRIAVDLPVSPLQQCQQQINELCVSGDDVTVINNILKLETDHPWLDKAKAALAAGSPLSARIIFRQLEQTKHASLAEVFQSEMVLVTNIMRYTEFAEGVRALLIDKDHKPRWQFTCAEDVTAEVLDAMFAIPNTGSTWPQNPLADLN